MCIAMDGAAYIEYDLTDAVKQIPKHETTEIWYAKHTEMKNE